jgi:hypothetical protein
MSKLAIELNRYIYGSFLQFLFLDKSILVSFTSVQTLSLHLLPNGHKAFDFIIISLACCLDKLGGLKFYAW